MIPRGKLVASIAALDRAWVDYVRDRGGDSESAARDRLYWLVRELLRDWYDETASPVRELARSL